MHTYTEQIFHHIVSRHEVNRALFEWLEELPIHFSQLSHPIQILTRFHYKTRLNHYFMFFQTFKLIIRNFFINNNIGFDLFSFRKVIRMSFFFFHNSFIFFRKELHSPFFFFYNFLFLTFFTYRRRQTTEK